MTTENSKFTYMKCINNLMTMKSKTLLLFLFLSFKLLATQTGSNFQNPVKGKVVTKSDGLGLLRTAGSVSTDYNV